MTALMYVTFLAVILTFDSFWYRVFTFGDNVPYAAAATAIRDWEPSTVRPYHFWGLPYVVAAVSLLTGAHALTAIIGVSILSSLVAVPIVYRLWGGWIGGYFVVLSWEWLQRSLLGGSEPLFMALIFGAFLAARRERWNLCTLLAAYSTTVRPHGIFVLVGIGVVLLSERKWRKLLFTTFLGAVVGILYMIPMQVYHGDPLANVSYYQGKDWNTGSPLSFPLIALVQAMLTSSVALTTIIREAFWVVLLALSAFAMLTTRRFRDFSRAHKVEATFAALYILFVFSYNSDWGLVEFARFALPVIPLALYSLMRYLPRDRRLLWLVAPVSAILAAASALNVRYVLDTIGSW